MSTFVVILIALLMVYGVFSVDLTIIRTVLLALLWVPVVLLVVLVLTLLHLMTKKGPNPDA